MTVSISGAIDFLQDKYALSPALQGPVISSSIIGGVGIGESVASYLGTKLSVTVVSAEVWRVCALSPKVNRIAQCTPSVCAGMRLVAPATDA